MSNKIDFPLNPVDGQIHTEGRNDYVYVAADEMWLGGPQGLQYSLNQRNQGFLASFYLGAFDKGNRPTLKSDGSPLVDFLFYFDTTDNIFYMYTLKGGWESIIRPVPAETSTYVYKADGTNNIFGGTDIEGRTFTLDPANPEMLKVHNATLLVQSTPHNVADFTVDYVASQVSLTRVPRKGTLVVIEVLTADSSKVTSLDPVIFRAKNTAAISSKGAGLPTTRIDAYLGAVTPKLGDMLIVSHDASVGAVNTYEGLWYYTSSWELVYKGASDGTGGSRVFTTTATTLNASKGLATTTENVLDAQFTALFRTAPKDGDWVVVPLETGSNSHFCGLFVRSLTTHTFEPAAPPWSNDYILGFVGDKAHKMSDLDIATKGIKSASIQIITTKGDREIQVVSGTSWVTIFKESLVRKWAAEASLWQSAINKADLTTLPPPSINNKGQYWTWKGTPAHVDNSFPVIGTDLNGEMLQIGDWIQSDGTKWIHIPADLINKSRWLSLGSIMEFDGTVGFEESSIIRFKPDTTVLGRWHYYTATADILANSGTPDVNPDWKDITPAVRPEELSGVEAIVGALKDQQILMSAGGHWKVVDLPPSGITDWDATTKFKENQVVLRRNMGAGDFNHPTTTHPTLYRARSNVADNINKDPDSGIAGAFWERIVFFDLKEAYDVDSTNRDDGRVLISTSTTDHGYAAIGTLLQWRDTDYVAGEVVYNKKGFYVANKDIYIGMPANTEPTVKHLDWDAVNPITALDVIDDVAVDPATVQNNAVMLRNTVTNKWNAEPISSLFAWVDKDYVVPAIVFSEHEWWEATAPVAAGDTAPSVASVGTANFKWRRLNSNYTPAVWDGATSYLSGKFVLRAPLGGTDTYKGPPLLFIVNDTVLSTNTDPLLDKINWGQVGAKADTLVPFSAADKYRKDRYVVFKEQIYWASADVPIGLEPKATPVLSHILRGTLIGEAGLTANALTNTDLQTFSTLTKDLPNNVGDYWRLDIGAGTIGTRVCGGLVTTSAQGFVVVVDKSDPAILGTNGYLFIPDTAGSTPAVWATNAPPTTIDTAAGGVTTNPWKPVGRLGELVDVDPTVVPTSDSVLTFDGGTKLWTPKDVKEQAKPIFPYDATAKYAAGNFAVLHDKIYMAKDRVSKFIPPRANTNIPITPKTTSTTGTGVTFAAWIATNPPIGAGYYNTSGGPMTVNGHGLTAFLLPDRQGLVYLGLHEDVNKTLTTGDLIVGGMFFDTTGVAATQLTQPDIDALVAADALANKMPAGQSPDTAPANWQLVGEKNASTLDDGSPTNNMLVWDDVNSKWIPNPNPSYTRKETDQLYMLEAIGEAGLQLLNQKVDSIVAGTAHGLEVQDIMNTPPAVALEGEVWIVGTSPTGDFVGHANELAWSDGTTWHFSPAVTKETHYVEQKQGTYNFNGTAWVKIASTTAAIAGASATGVGEIVSWPLAGALPDGLIELQGQILAVSTYPDLFAVIGNTFNAGTGADGTTTFALPDYRGYVLKGTGVNDDGAGTAGLTVGSKESDQNKAHRHTLNYGNQFSVIAQNAASFHQAGNTWSDLNPAGTAPAGVMNADGGTEVRVKSIATRWCMRYKGINAGRRGPSGKNYVDGVKAGQILEWDGTTWAAKDKPAATGWLYDKAVVGDHGFGALDTHGIQTIKDAKYKITARYSAWWAHNNNYINLAIKHGGNKLCITNSSATQYRNAETLFAVFTGTGNIETFSVTIEGSGGTLHDYGWVIERIK